MKKLTLTFVCVLAVTMLCGFSDFYESCYGISEKLLRLHVIANSDSQEDQALKLKVRDRLLEVGGELFENAGDLNEAQGIANDCIDMFTEEAREVIRQEGYDYNVSVSIEPSYYEVREYGDATIPSGVYDSLKVVIGNGSGKNWWCVMFPPMCVPAADGEVSADTVELEDVLNDDELDIVNNSQKYEIRLKCLEIVEDIAMYFKNRH